MKTICLDPVTPPLLTTRRPCDCPSRLIFPRREHFAPHDPFLSFATVDRPPPPAECDCWQPMTARALGQHSVGCSVFGPSPWIGQRVAIYADAAMTHDEWQRGESLGITPPPIRDAIVGSGTLAEALPICHWRDADNQTGREVNFGTGWLHPLSHEAQSWFAVHVERIAVTDRGLEHQGIGGRKGVVQDISDQLPLQDWSVGRWALRFTDVAPTGERCPECGGGGAWTSDGQRCYGCDGAGACAPVVAPVLSGDDPTYREWTP